MPAYSPAAASLAILIESLRTAAAKMPVYCAYSLAVGGTCAKPETHPQIPTANSPTTAADLPTTGIIPAWPNATWTTPSRLATDCMHDSRKAADDESVGEVDHECSHHRNQDEREWC